MEFTDKGKQGVPGHTRAIAQRGADNAASTAACRTRSDASHHFAIVLDNELISTPYINFRENPDGIDGEQRRRRSPAASRSRPRRTSRSFLKIGALPIRLELISRSQVSATLGKQALDQGLIAGLAGFAIVALFLLVFYRVLGVIAVARPGDLRALLLRAHQAHPDHADAAGHRGPDPHASASPRTRTSSSSSASRRRSAAADPSAAAHRRRATRRASRRSSTPTSSRCSSPSSCSSSPRRASRASRFMLGIGTIVSLFTAVLATQAILLSLRGTRVLQQPVGAGRRQAAQAAHVRLHGRVEVVLLDVRR